MRRLWLSIAAAALILGLGGLALAQMEGQQARQMPMGPMMDHGMMGGQEGQMGPMMPMMRGMMEMMNACTQMMNQMMGEVPSTPQQPSTK